MSKKKWILYSILSLLFLGFLYLYIWEKPKLELVVQKYIEAMSRDDSFPVLVDIEETHFSIVPLQVEIYNTEFSPKKDLKKTLSNLKINKVVIRPSLVDLLVGKLWLSLLKIEGGKIDINVPKSKNKNKSNEPLKIDLNEWLQKIPLSQAVLQNFKINLNYGDEWFVSTENLYIKAFNEKSSLIVTIKDPNLGLKNDKSKDWLNFLADIQVMITSNTIALSSIKVVKDSSFVVASGSMVYRDSPENIRELNIKSRIRSKFADIHSWSNQLYKNNHLKSLGGEFNADIQFEKQESQDDIETHLNAKIEDLQIDDLKLGTFNIDAHAPNEKQINISSIEAILAGDNKAIISNGKVHIDKKTEIKADLNLVDAQLHSFLRDSGIADIPVWLKVAGSVSCNGFYEKTLKIDCPGAVTIKDLKIKNKGRNKMIVASKKIDIAGSMTITEKNISYKAKAKINKSEGSSTGVIDFDKGFEIEYESPYLDLTDVGPIAEMEFLGVGETKGSTKGNSRAATFEMNISADNFEFEKYFFGNLSTHLRYKSGTLYFDKLSGSLESTRYNGNLQVNLLSERITGDIQLPFFRMLDIQQSVIKKVDLKSRFLGSGSGRVKIDTPFKVSQMGFQLDARLFKGSAFGEEYNEAKLKAEAVEGIIIVQQAKLQKEKTSFLMKGTLDTELNSDFNFSVNSGFLQLSTMVKEKALPVSGEFSANGKIFGKLSEPFIKTKAQVKNLIFNKKKYGDGLFSYDNSNKQTNLQFNIPKKLDFLVVLPENNFQSIFVDMNCEDLDVAPFVGYAVSEDSTRNYFIKTSGEISGKIDTQEPWNSEFSSTIKNINIDYKSNKLQTVIPTNIEMKNSKIFLNDVKLEGNKQSVTINQPYTEKYRTKFVINSRLNIAFFKLFAPFFEKIDGYSTLRLELSLNNKDMKLIGSSYTSGGFIKFPGFPHPVEGLTADVLFNQNKALINSISGTMAQGKVLGNGEILFSKPGEFEILLKSSIENASINFPEGYKTNGDAVITLSGKKAPFLLAGNYDIKGGLIEANFGGGGSGKDSDLLEELLKKEITSPLVLNIDLNTLNPVEVRNTLVEGYVEGNIKVFDKISAPRIKGTGRFGDDSIVKFQEQEFEVTSSEFIFEGFNPINPKLSMRANTRMNSYDIDLFLQGRAAKPILVMSSQPPLPQSQIISMLALGQLPDQFEQNNNGALNNNGNNGFEVGTGLLGNNPLAREIKEQSGFDVQISSSFDDQTGAAAPRLTIRKKITKKMQVSATGNANQYEGRLTYELNNEISTIFRVTSPNNNNNNDTGNNTNNSTQQSNPFGVDLEYKVEFD